MGAWANTVSASLVGDASFNDLVLSVGIDMHPFHLYRFSDHSEVMASSEAFIEVAASSPTSLNNLDQGSKALLDLITIATGRPSGLIEQALDRGHDHVVVIEQLVHHPSVKNDYNPVWPPFLFSCADLPWHEQVSRWLTLEAKLRPAVGVLLGHIYSDSHYLEEKAHAMASAAEAFHLNLYDHAPMSEEASSNLKEAVLTGVDSQHQEWVSSRFSNTLSFKKRMLDLADKPEASAVHLLIPHRSKWANLLTSTRNITSHASSNTQPTGSCQAG